MDHGTGKSVRDILLARRGVAFVGSQENLLPDDTVRAVEIELAELGYSISAQLQRRLASCSPAGIAAFRDWALRVLAQQVGGDQKHQPLFRRFPEGIPADTLDLWWTKVLVNFFQAEGQPCLFCRRVGTTHVLDPCLHVICDHCFDGTNYSACPVCEHHIDPSSPFIRPALEQRAPQEKIVFKLLDLGTSEEAESEKLFVSLCERKQALSPDDRDALIVIVREYRAKILSWLPTTVPLRENVAVVFGTLFREIGAAEVLPHARRYLTTATDVLRFIAVFSGGDASLQGETVFKTFERESRSSRFWGTIAKLLGAERPKFAAAQIVVPLRVRRFKVAKLSRSLRRSLLELMEGMNPPQLTEDMLRHRSYWVWIGEFLHPSEYAARYPNVAVAFLVVRKKGPDGTRAPKFRGWYARLEKTFVDKDVDSMLMILGARPGEFARRFDFALRLAGRDTAAVDRVVEAFVRTVPDFATPVLVMLRNHLPTRIAKAAVRIYWPKGKIAKGVSSTDERAALSERAIAPAVRAIQAELLRRFAGKPKFAVCLLDDDLRRVPVPFNERTGSRSAISLPRGACVQVPVGKTTRLFLHWCQPAKNSHSSDLDLSVAFYDQAWRYVGVCSYYQLQLAGKNGKIVARSSGDLRDAPWPDGASEFVDIHVDEATAMGARYAVMVVNNYAGLPFSLLERGYAGIMLRDDSGGAHFDPRTVAHKFALDGENGIFMPLVLDLQTGLLHWLDVQSKAQFEMNNVETSKATVSKICSELLTYFASGVRPSMYDLALLHAAARCERVIVRGAASLKSFARGPNETNEAFYERLFRGDDDGVNPSLPDPDADSSLAILFRGNVELAKQSGIYALFRERLLPTLAASDLLS